MCLCGGHALNSQNCVQDARKSGAREGVGILYGFQYVHMLLVRTHQVRTGAKFEHLLEWKSGVDRAYAHGFSLVGRACAIRFVCVVSAKGAGELDIVWWV